MRFGTDQDAVERVTAQLAGLRRLGVAFSGGVDSATLLALAVRALGADRVLGVIGVSPSLADDERVAAHAVARAIGVPVVEVATHEGERAAYRANGPDRCYHCKDELFTRIADEVRERARARRGRLRRERRRRGAPRPARLPRRHRARGAAPARRRRPGQGRRPARRPDAGPAVRGQARRALPGVPHPAPRAGHPGEARAGRGGRAGAARAGLRRLPGPAPRRRGPDRAAGRRPGARRRRAAARARSTGRSPPPGSASWQSTSAGIQSGAFTLPLVAVRRG